jgi:hypothetical protein
MNVYEFSNLTDTSIPITDELTFLRQQTGQDETTILIQALHVGLRTLYQQIVEQLFIDGTFPREKAVTILGTERVAELEYAQHALEQDVTQGLNL